MNMDKKYISKIKSINTLIRICFLIILLSGCSQILLKNNRIEVKYCYKSNDTSMIMEVIKNRTFKLYENISKYYVTLGCFDTVEYINRNEFILRPKQYEFDRVPFILERRSCFSNDSITIITKTFLNESGDCYLLYNSQRIRVNPDYDTIRLAYCPELKINIEADIIKEFDNHIYSPVSHISTDTITLFPNKNELFYIETTPLYIVPLQFNVEPQRVSKNGDNFNLTIHGYRIPFKLCL